MQNFSCSCLRSSFGGFACLAVGARGLRLRVKLLFLCAQSFGVVAGFVLSCYNACMGVSTLVRAFCLSSNFLNGCPSSRCLQALVTKLVCMSDALITCMPLRGERRVVPVSPCVKYRGRAREGHMDVHAIRALVWVRL